MTARSVAMQAYLDKLGIELHGEAYIFHNRSGSPYSRDTPGDDFRDDSHSLPLASETSAPWQTFVGAEPTRPLQVRPRLLRWHTLWETHSAPQMRYSRPTAR